MKYLRALVVYPAMVAAVGAVLALAFPWHALPAQDGARLFAHPETFWRRP